MLLAVLRSGSSALIGSTCIVLSEKAKQSKSGRYWNLEFLLVASVGGHTLRETVLEMSPMKLLELERTYFMLRGPITDKEKLSNCCWSALLSRALR